MRPSPSVRTPLILSAFLALVCCLPVRPAAAQEPPPESWLDVLTPGEQKAMESAVDKALAWIASRQQPDGRFPTRDPGQPGVTALCTLAFLSRGHLPGEGRYGETINNALDFVKSCQMDNGLITYLQPPGIAMHNPSHTASYNHAIGGLLLTESYGLAGGMNHEKIPDMVERAVQFVVRKQTPAGGHPHNQWDQGGWRYIQPWPQCNSDLSVTSWNLMFLRSARNAGFEVPSSVIDRAMDYVKRCYQPDLGTFYYGLFYGDQRDTRAMAGAGILALSLGGLHHTEMAQTAGDWLLRNNFHQYLGRGRNYYDTRYFYGAFYGAQASLQLGNPHWQQFYPGMVKALVDNQHGDGSWDAEPGEDAHYGNVYSTSMAVLALTTPYQLLPIYQR